MRRENSSITETYVDGVEVVFAKHFHQLYGRTPAFDPSIVDLLPQAPPFTGIEGPSTDDEIDKSVSHLHATSPGYGYTIPIFTRGSIVSVLSPIGSRTHGMRTPNRTGSHSSPQRRELAAYDTRMSRKTSGAPNGILGRRGRHIVQDGPPTYTRLATSDSGDPSDIRKRS